MSEASAEIARAVTDIKMPSTIRGSLQGTARAFQASIATEPFLVLAAIVVIYIVLGILYESYIHPITILSTLPSAGVGAVLALMLFGTEFSVIALIGVILLIGIVKKNAILMIDFAIDAKRSRGLSAHDSIFEACLLRFRPIMMTTMAAMFGALPLALSFGSGSEMRQPLGIAIVGGLMVSQLLARTPPRSCIFIWTATVTPGPNAVPGPYRSRRRAGCRAGCRYEREWPRERCPGWRLRAGQAWCPALRRGWGRPPPGLFAALRRRSAATRWKFGGARVI